MEQIVNIHVIPILSAVSKSQYSSSPAAGRALIFTPHILAEETRNSFDYATLVRRSQSHRARQANGLAMQRIGIRTGSARLTGDERTSDALAARAGDFDFSGGKFTTPDSLSSINKVYVQNVLNAHFASCGRRISERHTRRSLSVQFNCGISSL
jgi:hypothetical protein